MPELITIANDLRAQGFSVCTNFVLSAEVAALRDELHATATEFRAAGIGRDQVFQRDVTVRSDRIRWLDPQAPAQGELLARVEQLRLVLNRELLLGLFDYEAHFAHYDAGAFYQRHRDTFASAAIDDAKPRRIVSTVLYLNDDWDAGDGGELVLYDTDDSELRRVLPQAGTAVFFLSEEFPHEVLPARRERYSIAGWLRRRGA